jgi:hypothetical protein
MSHLDILLPFGLPPENLAKDLLRELKTPALATLIARAQAPHHKRFDDTLRALPHEHWLAERFGIASPLPAGSSPALAAAAMTHFGVPAKEGIWFLLHPVSLSVTRTQMLLDDPRQLKLDESHARPLFKAALPLFEAAGKELRYGDAQTWFVRADDWPELRTSTPDAALGRSVDSAQPQGPGEREWRRLHNEVQMHWFTHPVNAGREANGLKPVNALWLWGGARAARSDAERHYHAIFNLPPQMRGIDQFAAVAARGDLAQLLSGAPGRALLVLDPLLQPALAGEWHEWLTGFEALETEWFAPLLEALRNGRAERVSLVLTHALGWREYAASRNSLRKFWIKPALARLQP